MKKTYAHNRLILLIAVSFCVHALFLYNSNNKISIPSQQGNIFAVHLKTIYPEPQKKTETKKKINNRSKQLTQKNTRIERNTPNKTHTHVVETTVSAKSNDIIRSVLLSKIKTKFTKHFDYPQLAKRKGWQGKVNLTFNISKQGNISDILIKNSSGYAILDQAAYHSLTQIKNIEITDRPFNTRQSFNLPVIYKLYEG